jgi:NADH oxidase (H2O2-forming)
MKVIVIGNGIAGNTASSTIRRLNRQAEITIISEERYPFYSACALPQYLAGELRRPSLFLRARRDYSREGIKVVLGQRVTRISPEDKMVFLDHKSLAYDKLIIATGSQPIMPPIEGINLDGVFALKSLNDADQIRHTATQVAVIVGSGPIGVEAGIALSKKGGTVYVIELLGRIMPRIFDDKPSSLLRDTIEQNGIRILTDESVTCITGNNKVEGIVTSKRHIECDTVIVAAGMKPNAELARQMGVNTGKLGGISVTRQMMTNLDDIYACGDCVEAEDAVTGKPTLSLLWHNAREQGLVAGSNCRGVSRIYPGSINITSLDIFNTHAVSLGSIATDVSQPEPVEIIERSGSKNYLRLILSQERLIGAQAIGDTQDTGALLYAMLRKDKLTEPKQLVGERPLLPLVRRDYGVVGYRASRPLAAKGESSRRR